MIAPAILVSNFNDFEDQVKQLEGIFEYAQIDVMDGIFVTNKSFSEIEKINGLGSALKFELHLMTEHPLQEIKKWKGVKNVFRVIFHIEAKDDPTETIKTIQENGWQTGICLNPETPLTAIEPYYKLVDTILFMTVHPGKHGAPYLPEVSEKIKEYSGWPNRPKCAVDGGIDEKNMEELKSIGVEIFNIGSNRAINFV
ncbi:MAG: hypothetical protein WC526_04730 [Patescibacteria group bacterium]